MALAADALLGQLLVTMSNANLIAVLEQIGAIEITEKALFASFDPAELQQTVQTRILERLHAGEGTALPVGSLLEQMLRQLNSVPAKQLSASEQVNAAVFRTVLENALIELRFRTWEMPLNSDSQFWSDLGFMSSRHLKNEKQAREYIGKLNDFPRYFDENIANMRAGVKRGFTVPRAVLERPGPQ